MAITRNYLPIIPIARRQTEGGFNMPEKTKYDELVFDYKTNRYITLSQQREIDSLRHRLSEQKEQKKKELQNIIGYYYKRKV